jgi:toxin ParE1/3/4
MLFSRFHPAARLEARDLAPRLGGAFVELVDKCIGEVCQLPHAWPTWPGRNDVRRRVLRRWPISLIYSVDDVSVFIVALAHDRRQPGYWLPRV